MICKNRYAPEFSDELKSIFNRLLADEMDRLNVPQHERPRLYEYLGNHGVGELATKTIQNTLYRGKDGYPVSFVDAILRHFGAKLEIRTEFRVSMQCSVLSSGKKQKIVKEFGFTRND